MKKFSARYKKTAYRVWQRAVFRVYSKLSSAHYPPQVIFIHIPKTAGSSINEYFSSFIGRRGSSDFLPIDIFRNTDDWAYAEVNEEGLQKARTSKFITGHIDWHTLEKIRHPHAFTFTFLRDPVERLVSAYHYLHHIDENTLSGENEKKVLVQLKSLTLEDFFSGSDFKALYATNNLMVRTMAGRVNGTAGMDIPFEAMLEQSIKNIKTLNYVGFQKTFDDDFRNLVRKSGFPVLRLPKENITEKLPAHPGPSYEAGANKQVIMEMAAPRLKWDFAFYQRALELAPGINGRPFVRG